MKDYKDYTNFLFRAKWRDLIDELIKQGKEEEAKELVWSIMIAGTTGEIKSDIGVHRALLQNMYLPEIEYSRKISEQDFAPSKGEKAIAKALEALDIKYQREYEIPLLGPHGGRRRMDFAVFGRNGDIKCFIEYQGEQHYQDSDYFSTKVDMIQDADCEKRDYCKEENIPLIEVPYWDFDKICDKYVWCKIKEALEKGGH